MVDFKRLTELTAAAKESAQKATPYTRVDIGNGFVNVYTEEVVIDRYKEGASWQRKRDCAINTWQQASNRLPEIGQKVLVYYYDKEYADFYFGALVPAPQPELKIRGIKGPYFHVRNYTGHECIYCQPEFENVFWKALNPPVVDKDDIETILNNHKFIKL